VWDEQEHKIRDELMAVMEDQKHDNQAKQPQQQQQPQSLHAVNAERRSVRERIVPRKVDGGMHRWNNRPHVQPDAVEPQQLPAEKFLVTNDDDAPDLSMYVKRMSLTDDKGCSSGQVRGGARGVLCVFACVRGKEREREVADECAAKLPWSAAKLPWSAAGKSGVGPAVCGTYAYAIECFCRCPCEGAANTSVGRAATRRARCRG